MRKKNQMFVILVSIPVRCIELAEPIDTTCAKAHSARLHRWRVDGYLRQFKRTRSPPPKGKNVLPLDHLGDLIQNIFFDVGKM